MVQVGSWDGTFRALDAATGRTVWTFDTGGVIAGPPAAIDDDLVAFTSSDSFLYALDSRSGRLRWRFDLQSSYADQYGAALSDSTVFVGSALGMHALRRDSGGVRWQVVTDGRPLGTPALAGDTLYFATLTNWIDSTLAEGFAYALSGRDGRVLWRHALPRTRGKLGGARVGVVSCPGVVIVPCADGQVRALDRATGQERWTHRFPEASLTACGTDDSTVFAGSLDGSVAALDVRDGTVRWQIHMDASIESGPITVADGVVGFAAGDAKAFGLDARTGAQRFNAPGALNPVIQGGFLYCGRFNEEVSQNYVVSLAIVPAWFPSAHRGSP